MFKFEQIHICIKIVMSSSHLLDVALHAPLSRMERTKAARGWLAEALIAHAHVQQAVSWQHEATPPTGQISPPKPCIELESSELLLHSARPRVHASTAEPQTRAAAALDSL